MLFIFTNQLKSLNSELTNYKNQNSNLTVSKILMKFLMDLFLVSAEM
jgi:hypothetical protein